MTSEWGMFLHNPLGYRNVRSIISFRIFSQDNESYLMIIISCPTMYLLNHFAMGGMWHKVHFSAEYNSFKFKSFLLLHRLPYQVQWDQSVLIFTQSWKKTSWIHTFSKDISVIWNAITLVLDLKSACQVQILWRILLHYERHLQATCNMFYWISHHQ